MKRGWALQAARINALSLRERLFLLGSLLVICIALADLALLSPAQLRHKQAQQSLEKQSGELNKSRAAMRGLSDARAIQALKAQLHAITIQTQQVDQAIRAATSGSADAAQVLVHLLRRYEGLTLVSAVSMAPDAQKPPASGWPPGLTRHGLALTVSGPYPQLVSYVLALEAALPHVRWGALQLKSEKQPPELMLQLFTVGVTP